MRLCDDSSACLKEPSEQMMDPVFVHGQLPKLCERLNLKHHELAATPFLTRIGIIPLYPKPIDLGEQMAAIRAISQMQDILVILISQGGTSEDSAAIMVEEEEKALIASTKELVASVVSPTTTLLVDRYPCTSTEIRRLLTALSDLRRTTDRIPCCIPFRDVTVAGVRAKWGFWAKQRRIVGTNDGGALGDGGEMLSIGWEGIIAPYSTADDTASPIAANLPTRTTALVVNAILPAGINADDLVTHCRTLSLFTVGGRAAISRIQILADDDGDEANRSGIRSICLTLCGYVEIWEADPTSRFGDPAKVNGGAVIDDQSPFHSCCPSQLVVIRSSKNFLEGTKVLINFGIVARVVRSVRNAEGAPVHRLPTKPGHWCFNIHEMTVVAGSIGCELDAPLKPGFRRFMPLEALLLVLFAKGTTTQHDAVGNELLMSIGRMLHNTVMRVALKPKLTIRKRPIQIPRHHLCTGCSVSFFNEKGSRGSMASTALCGDPNHLRAIMKKCDKEDRKALLFYAASLGDMVVIKEVLHSRGFRWLADEIHFAVSGSGRKANWHLYWAPPRHYRFMATALAVECMGYLNSIARGAMLARDIALYSSVRLLIIQCERMAELRIGESQSLIEVHGLCRHNLLAKQTGWVSDPFLQVRTSKLFTEILPKVFKLSTPANWESLLSPLRFGWYAPRPAHQHFQMILARGDVSSCCLAHIVIAYFTLYPEKLDDPASSDLRRKLKETFRKCGAAPGGVRIGERVIEF